MAAAPRRIVITIDFRYTKKALNSGELDITGAKIERYLHSTLSKVGIIVENIKMERRDGARWVN